MSVNHCRTSPPTLSPSVVIAARRRTRVSASEPPRRQPAHAASASRSQLRSEYCTVVRGAGLRASSLEWRRARTIRGFTWSGLRRRTFAEWGGSAALSGRSASDRVSATSLGVRAVWPFEWSGRAFTISPSVSWRRASGDLRPTSRLVLDSGPSFAVSGQPIARDAVAAGLELGITSGRSATIAFSYSGQYASTAREHSAGASLRWQF